MVVESILRAIRGSTVMARTCVGAHSVHSGHDRAPDEDVVRQYRTEHSVSAGGDDVQAAAATASGFSSVETHVRRTPAHTRSWWEADVSRSEREQIISAVVISRPTRIAITRAAGVLLAVAAVCIGFSGTASDGQVA
eukprot:1054972-Rhodomonas_salina.1